MTVLTNRLKTESGGQLIREGGVMMLLREKLLDTGCLKDTDSRIFALNGEIPEQAPLSSLYKKCGISRGELIDYFREENHAH